MMEPKGGLNNLTFEPGQRIMFVGDRLRASNGHILEHGDIVIVKQFLPKTGSWNAGRVRIFEDYGNVTWNAANFEPLTPLNMIAKRLQEEND